MIARLVSLLHAPEFFPLWAASLLVAGWIWMQLKPKEE